MELKVGFGRYNITPPLGVPMAGYMQREGCAEDLHDELTARAVVFECNGESAALVLADVCMLPEWCPCRVRVKLSERTGIPEGHVVVAATHTHSGPALHEESAYRDLLPDLMASAGQLAWKHRRPARLFYGTGQAEGLCINRRELSGPVDEEFAFLMAEDAEGNALGVLFSYALHGVVMGHNNLSISADHIGVARRVIEDGLPGAQAVFVAAPSGDINPLTPSVKDLLEQHGEKWFTDDPLTGIYDRSTGTFDEVEQIGRALGEAVLRSLPDKEAVGAAKLGGKAWTVDIGDESEVGITPCALELGDVTILALPGEHFVESGTALKQMASDAGRRLLMVTHAGRLCYVPPREAFAQGGYEVESARSKGLAEDAQQRILESVRQELFAG